jgi:hypothetical protein
VTQGREAATRFFVEIASPIRALRPWTSSQANVSADSAKSTTGAMRPRPVLLGGRELGSYQLAQFVAKNTQQSTGGR